MIFGFSWNIVLLLVMVKLMLVFELFVIVRLRFSVVVLIDIWFFCELVWKLLINVVMLVLVFCIVERFDLKLFKVFLEIILILMKVLVL